MSLFPLLGAAIVGNFEKEIEQERRYVEAALQGAVFEFTDESQQLWRSDVERSRLARSSVLSKTIRTRKYRNAGINPAGLVYSTFPVIQKAFEQTTVVRSPNGFFLPIPNPAVWPGGRVAKTRRGAGRNNSIAIAERRFGPLRFVYRQGKPSLLVAEVRSRKTGGFGRASDTARSTGRGLTTIVVFFLVKEARLPRLLRGREIRRRIETNAPRRVDQLYVKHYDRAGAPRQLTHLGGDG